MAIYRVNFLDDFAHTSGPPVILECASDDQAKKQARAYTDGNIEIWQASRLVAMLSKKSRRSVRSQFRLKIARGARLLRYRLDW